MEGQKDTWATALALALLEDAQAERRPFTLIDFNGRVTYEATVEPCAQLPHEALFVSCGGGTSIAAAFERGLEIIAHHPRALRQSDIVLITDGGSDPERSRAARARPRARRHEPRSRHRGRRGDARLVVRRDTCREQRRELGGEHRRPALLLVGRIVAA